MGNIVDQMSSAYFSRSARVGLACCSRLVNNVPVKPKKDEEIKARVEGSTKSQLWLIAGMRGLDVSDIVREALRDFIRKNQASIDAARV